MMTQNLRWQGLVEKPSAGLPEHDGRHHAEVKNPIT